MVVKHKHTRQEHMDFLVVRLGPCLPCLPLAKPMDRRELAKAWPCNCQLNSSGGVSVFSTFCRALYPVNMKLM